MGGKFRTLVTIGATAAAMLAVGADAATGSSISSSPQPARGGPQSYKIGAEATWVTRSCT